MLLEADDVTGTELVLAERLRLSPWPASRGAADGRRTAVTSGRDIRGVAGPLAGPATGPYLGARDGRSWETYGIARYPVSPAADLVPHDLSSVK